MRKKGTIVLLLALISAAPVYACTSFAVYFQEPIYGLNLDWDDSLDVRLELQELFGTIVFAILFLTRLFDLHYTTLRVQIEDLYHRKRIHLPDKIRRKKEEALHSGHRAATLH